MAKKKMCRLLRHNSEPEIIGSYYLVVEVTAQSDLQEQRRNLLNEIVIPLYTNVGYLLIAKNNYQLAINE